MFRFSSVLTTIKKYKYDYYSTIHIMKCTVEVRQRGIITIPDAIRKALKIEDGDIIELDIQVVKYEK